VLKKSRRNLKYLLQEILMAKAKSASINIGLGDKQRSGVIEILNAALADEFVLYTKTRNFHWNVTGPQFNDLHKFFEAQYEEIEGFIDDIAERARALGGAALGSLQGYLKHTRLKENNGAAPAAMEMVAELLNDHEIVIRQLRADIAKVSDKFGDEGSADFLTGSMEAHEKMAWMLRAFLG
jgi:starvation-inducible DNA-binding protein